MALESIIQHGFLSGEWFKALDESWPEPPNGKGFRSHMDLAHFDPRFEELSTAWKDLRVFLCGESLWSEIIQMIPSLLDYPLDRFQPDAYEDGKGIQTPISDCQYPRMDLGWGGVGYGVKTGGAGTHLDHENRVISGLIYFTDQSECEGGEFELVDKGGNLIHRVPLRKNLCIMTVQNKDGWHRVNPVTKVNGWRRAVYFALSDTRGIR